MNTLEFVPLTDEKKRKVLEHYRQMLLEAQELARLNALPKSERARELRNALEDIARARHEQQTLTEDPDFAIWLDRIDAQNNRS